MASAEANAQPLRGKIGVIGGGIVGLATALKLSEANPDSQITLFEKEAEVGRHQSGNNSGVLHAGLYYKPGSFKAKLATRGIRMMKDFCRDHSIPYDICGKLVIATEPEEIPRLKDLFERGTANGLKDLQELGPEQIREIEPHAAGIAAIRVPEEGIVDYRAVSAKMAALLRARGAQVLTGTPVTELARDGNGWRVRVSTKGASSGEGQVQSHALDWIVNCAGLHCDRVARMAGERPTTKIVPFRGEYFELKAERAHLVKHLIYPVPDPKFPFLGVHFTRMMKGGVECGPNAVLAFKREGYRKTDFALKDFAETLAFPGLWRFLRKYPSMSWSEFRRSMSKRLFCASLQRLVPEVQISDLSPGGAGVRAQAMSPDGALIQDFDIVKGTRAIHVLNAPSPGATSSLAIGEEIAARLKELASS